MMTDTTSPRTDDSLPDDDPTRELIVADPEAPDAATSR